MSTISNIDAVYLEKVKDNCFRDFYVKKLGLRIDSYWNFVVLPISKSHKLNLTQRIIGQNYLMVLYETLFSQVNAMIVC